MNKKELRTKYKALLEQLRTMAQAGVTDANRADYTAKEAEMRAIGDQLSQLDAIDERDAEVRAREEADRVRDEAETRAQRSGRPPIAQPGTTASENRSAEERETEYRSALLHYMRTGDHSELRVQQSTVGQNGGYSIPTTLLPDLERAVLTYGGLANAVRSLQTAHGEPINWPVSNNTSLAATVLAENTAQSDTTLVMGTKQLNVSTLVTGIVRLPFQLMQDSVFDWEAFSRGELGESYARGIANYIGNVTQDASFDPIVTSVSVGATSAAAKAVGLADITAIFGAVDPAYANNGTFVMNRTTQLYLAALRNGLGAPIFQQDADGMLTKIFGRPIVIDTTMPNIAAGNKAILFGDLSKYILRRSPGLEIKRLDERYAEFGQVAFLGFFRAGARYLNAGTNPIQSLQQAAS